MRCELTNHKILLGTDLHISGRNSDRCRIYQPQYLRSCYLQDTYVDYARLCSNMSNKLHDTKQLTSEEYYIYGRLLTHNLLIS